MKKTYFLLGIIVLFGIILRLVFFGGIEASDDLGNAKYAYEISENQYSFPSTHHGTRLGILYPVSYLYNWFGINEFSSTLFPILTSIAGIILIFHLGRIIFNEKVGLLAAFLLSFFPLHVIYSTKLLTDLPSAFFLGLGMLFFFLGNKNENNWKSKINYFISGASIGVAYLIRETALLIGFFFIVYIIFYKKLKRDYFFILIGLSTGFILESIIFYINTGDFLFRFNALTYNYYSVAESSEFFGRGSFPFLLLNYPYIMFTSTNVGIFYPFIFIALFYIVAFRKKEAYPLFIWFIPVLLYLSFGTLSLTSYVPFAAVPRYLSIVTIPAILILAFFLMDNTPIIRKVVMPATILILLVTSLGFIYLDSDSRNSTDNLKSIYPIVKEIKKPIYTDERSKVVFDYLSKYSKELDIKEFNSFVDYENIPPINLSRVNDAYVLVNNKLIRGVMEAHPFDDFELPEEITDIPKEWVVIKKIGKETTLYYIP